MDLLERPVATRRHPWEVARADCLLGMLGSSLARADIADVGAGDLYIAQQLVPRSQGRVFAVELGQDGLEVPAGIRLCRNIEELGKNSVDILLLLDVLEHVPDDRGFLAECLTRLRPGGRVLITVPAFPMLFSAHDRFLKHYRRYSCRSLAALLSQTGLKADEMFYFFSLLWPLRALGKCLEKLKKNPPVQSDLGRWPFSDSGWISGAVAAVLRMDFKINRKLSGWGLRIGGLSLCAQCSLKSA